VKVAVGEVHVPATTSQDVSGKPSPSKSPIPKSQMYPVTPVSSVLPVASKSTDSPSAGFRFETVPTARGGLLVIDAETGPPTVIPGIGVARWSVIMTSDSVKERGEAGSLSSSKATLARRVPALIVLPGSGAETVRVVYLNHRGRPVCIDQAFPVDSPCEGLFSKLNRGIGVL